jgi:hypothetical protein
MPEPRVRERCYPRESIDDASIASVRAPTSSPIGVISTGLTPTSMDGQNVSTLISDNQAHCTNNQQLLSTRNEEVMPTSIGNTRESFAYGNYLPVVNRITEAKPERHFTMIDRQVDSTRSFENRNASISASNAQTRWSSTDSDNGRVEKGWSSDRHHSTSDMDFTIDSSNESIKTTFKPRASINDEFSTDFTKGNFDD